MKYKPGDKVRIRQWNAMAKEYGIDEFDRSVRTPKFHFTKQMKKYCGEIATIICCFSDDMGEYYMIDVDGRKFRWTDDMFEGYAFSYGDEIEVSDDGKNWYKRIYVGYIDGCIHPYVCKDMKVPSEEEKSIILLFGDTQDLSKRDI